MAAMEAETSVAVANRAAKRTALTKPCTQGLLQARHSLSSMVEAQYHMRGVSVLAGLPAHAVRQALHVCCERYGLSQTG